MFHAPDGLRDLHGVPGDILVFKYDVKPADDVTHQVWRAKTDAYSSETQERQRRYWIDAAPVQRRQNRYNPDHFDGRTINEARQRAGLLFAELLGARLACSGLDQQIGQHAQDRKSTRLNSSHQIISYAVFCLKKKNTNPIVSCFQLRDRDL